MPIIPSIFPSPTSSARSSPESLDPSLVTTWAVIGASRGIGLEFVRQAIARGDRVVAAVRDPFRASDLYQATAASKSGRCMIHQCDVTDERSIDAFVERMKAIPDLRLDNLVLNAGILQYPNRATEVSFATFAAHLATNTIGPILIASKLFAALSPTHPIRKIIFISSDSGSTTSFRAFEDGFAAYAASKAALNQMLRHMAAEIRRKEDAQGLLGERDRTTVLAMHPGEVSTDMANVDLSWEVEGIISAEESVRGLFGVIESKGPRDTGTFWTWDGREHPW